MATRAQVRDRVRAELGDTAAPYVWSEALLNEWLNTAIRDWSRISPPQRSATIATVAGTRRYTLSAPHQGLLAVRLGGVALPEWFWVAVNDGNSQQVSLSFDPGAGSLEVDYLGFFALPAADGDALEVETVAETALVYRVCELAARWLDAQREKRGVETSGAAPAFRSLYEEQWRAFRNKVRSYWLAEDEAGS